MTRIAASADLVTRGDENGKTMNEGADAPAHGRRLSVSVLASGSRGNATYISDGHTAILIDAGLSGVEIQRRMTR
jgi:hypothetical protein